MAVEVTTAPASPSTDDGITVTVTGAVPGRARVEMSLAGKVRETSPVFEQGENPEGLNPSAYTLAVSATGGTYTLTVHGDVTAAIAFGANAAAVKAALDAVLDAGESCTVTGTTTKTITFSPSTSAFTLTVQTGSLTGGSATVTAVTTGNTQAESASGPFSWGPLFLPDDGSWSIDVVAAEDNEDLDLEEGDTLLAAPVTLVVT